MQGHRPLPLLPGGKGADTGNVVPLIGSARRRTMLTPDNTLARRLMPSASVAEDPAHEALTGETV